MEGLRRWEERTVARELRAAGEEMVSRREMGIEGSGRGSEGR